MAVSISANFITGFYSGHHTDQTVYPPSPARLVSALLSAAHRSPEFTEDGRGILQMLCEASDPTLVVPKAYKGGSGETYMQQPLASAAGTNVKEEQVSGAQRIMGERGGKVRKRSNGHFTVTGDLYFVWEDLEFDDTQLALLNQLAEDVGYLGRESDLVLLKASRQSKSNLILKHRETHSFYRPMPKGGKKLRVLSRGYLNWLDDRHASIFDEDAREPIPVDHRVRTAFYAPIAIVPDSDETIITLPFKRPLRLNQAVEIARKIHADDGGVVFPLARAGHRHLDGAAVGLGVITRGGIRLDDDFDMTSLGEDTGAITLQPDYWVRAAKVWMTAVPFVGHPDRWVATQQILSAVPDARILELSTTPVRPSQQRMKTSSTQRAWHVVLRIQEAIAGPLLLDRTGGTGVCLPDYQNQEAN